MKKIVLEKCPECKRVRKLGLWYFLSRYEKAALAANYTIKWIWTFCPDCQQPS